MDTLFKIFRLLAWLVASVLALAAMPAWAEEFNAPQLAQLLKQNKEFRQVMQVTLGESQAFNQLRNNIKQAAAQQTGTQAEQLRTTLQALERLRTVVERQNSLPAGMKKSIKALPFEARFLFVVLIDRLANQDKANAERLVEELPDASGRLQQALSTGGYGGTAWEADLRQVSDLIGDVRARGRTAQTAATGGAKTSPNFVSSEKILEDPSRVAITVNFATNQADILPQYRPQLDALGSAIQKLQGVSFEIGGHSDQRGPDEANLRLSEQRAEAVRQYLIKNAGIPGDRLLSRGYGETSPLDARDIAAAWDRNRRVEVVLLGSAAAQPLLTIESGGHRNFIKKILFTPDGKHLVSAGQDKQIRVWDLSTGRTERVILGSKGKGFEGSINGMALSPDGQLLAVGGMFSPTTANTLLAGGTTAGTIRLHDFASGRMIDVLKGHQGPIMALAFSPDGTRLASASGDMTVRIWDVQRRSTLRVLQANEMTGESLLFSPDGQRLASKTVNGVALWSVSSGNRLATLSNPSSSSSAAFDSAALALDFAWDPQDRWIATASADGAVRLWDSRTGKPLRVLAQVPTFPVRVAFSRDGERLLVTSMTSPYEVHVYSVADGARLQSFTGHHSSVIAVNVSPNGRTAATGAAGTNEILVWDIASGRIEQTLKSRGSAVFALGVSGDGGSLAFGFADPCPEQTMSVCPERTTPLQQGLALKNAEGTWNLASTAPIRDQTGFVRAKLAHGPYRIRGILASETEDDIKDAIGPVVKSMGFGDGVVGVGIAHDAQGLGSKTGFELAHMIYSAYSFTGDGRYVAAAGMSGEIGLYRVPDMRKVASLVGHEPAFVTALAPSPNGRLLYSAGQDQSIRVWDISNLPPVDFDSIDKEVIEMWKKFSPDADQNEIVETLKEMGIPTHKVPEIAPLLTVFPTDDGEWVAWTRSGYYTASPKGDQFIGWHMNRGQDRAADWYGADQFAATFYRPDVVAKTLELGSEESALQALGRDRQWATPVTVVKHAPPTIAILSPQDGTASSAEQIDLRFEIHKQNDDPLKEVVVLVNGRPLSGIRGLERAQASAPEEASRQIAREVSVPLIPGRNLVQVIAATEFARSNPATVVVERQVAAAPAAAGQAPSAMKSRLFVLAVGVSRYAKAEYNLDFAHRDAEALVEVLKTQQGKLFGEVNAKLLLDDQATRKNVLGGLDWLGGMAQNDMAIVFLAGHGQTSDQNHFYFLGHDAEFDHLRQTALKWTEFRDTLSELPGKVILMADACHAGAATRENKRRDGTGVWNPDELARAFSSLDSGIVIFMASQGREFSQENPQWQHGAFTKALLDAFQGNGDLVRDGVLYLSELTTYVQQTVPKLTGNSQHPMVGKPQTVPDYPIAVF